MKKMKILKGGVIAACCISALCAKELMASAEITFHSRGNFVTDDGEVAFYRADLDYLGKEISTLESEIDSSLEQVYGRPLKSSRQGTMKSRGIIDYDNGMMVLDSRDVMELAVKLDLLENRYAASARTALCRIGSIIDSSGNISHIENGNETISMPTLEQIRKEYVSRNQWSILRMLHRQLQTTLQREPLYG